MKIIKDKIDIKILTKMASSQYGSLVKAVVDVDREIMVIDGNMHADEEALLLSDGSKQEDLWGINIYPEMTTDDWIEFDSIINLRPAEKNFSRGVENPKIRGKIVEIVNKLVKK